MDMMQVGYYVNDCVDLSRDYMSCDDLSVNTFASVFCHFGEGSPV